MFNHFGNGFFVKQRQEASCHGLVLKFFFKDIQDGIFVKDEMDVRVHMKE